jgi:hypothetical protein
MHLYPGAQNVVCDYRGSIVGRVRTPEPVKSQLCDPRHVITFFNLSDLHFLYLKKKNKTKEKSKTLMFYLVKLLQRLLPASTPRISSDFWL